MCGIIGYTGTKNAEKKLCEGLYALEYRGYDSAGISVFVNEKIVTVKTKGRVDSLVKKLDERRSVKSSDANSEENKQDTGVNFGIPDGVCCGIGHTRWATHGAPSDKNAHPHTTKSLSLVHNGIIENYIELKHFLAEKGYEFESETDTEATAKLLDFHYIKAEDPKEAIRKTTAMIRGSYAFAIIFADRPGIIYAVRRDSPLILAPGKDGNYVASDLPAVLKNTRSYIRLLPDEIAEVESESYTVYDSEGLPVKKDIEENNWDIDAAEKGGYRHFMLKEIFEQPEAVKKTVRPRIKNGLPDFSDEYISPEFKKSAEKNIFTNYDLITEMLKNAPTIHIAACGSAMHSGLVGKNIIEAIARKPVTVNIASEFRYQNPVFDESDVVILISQSGETADTLAALRLAKERKVFTLAVVNVAGSAVAREADAVIYTYAGPEIAVATTKGYSAQLSVLYLIALRLALVTNTMVESRVRMLTVKLLMDVPKDIEEVTDTVKLTFGMENNGFTVFDRIAEMIYQSENLFYIGRGLDYALSAEGSLKLKEISYIHSEAYAAGELKHGTISLISEGTPVIAIMTVPELAAKMLANVREVCSRGGKVILLCSKSWQKNISGSGTDGNTDITNALKTKISENTIFEVEKIADEVLYIPDDEPVFSPFSVIACTQIIAYKTACLREKTHGCDVDRPRNLAKSVTVE